MTLAHESRNARAMAKTVVAAVLVLGATHPVLADSLALQVDAGSSATLAPNQSTTVDIVYIDNSTSGDQLTQYDAYFSYDPSKLTLSPVVNGPAVSGTDFQTPPLFHDSGGTVTGGNFATTGLAVTAGNSYVLAQFTVTATSGFASGTTVLNLLPTDSIGSTDLGFASGQFLDSSAANGSTQFFDTPVTSGTNDAGDVSLTATAVPEPASVVTIGVGLCGVLVLWRRFSIRCGD
jgi:hypothetical protein